MTRRANVGRSWWNLYVFPLVMVIASIVTIVAVARRPDAGTTDFRTFYQSASQYLAGDDPYVPFDANRGPNLNPPWVVVIMAQLCRLPIAAAVAVWWAFSFVCFAAAMVLIARAVAPGHAVTIASLVLVTQAAYTNLRLGQVAWPLLLLVTTAWLADRSKKPVLCGLLIGVAASWKPFLLIFVPYLLWRREWRSLAWMTAAFAVSSVAGFFAVGSAGFASWISVVREVGWTGHPLNASLRALFTRVLTTASLVEQPTTPSIVAPSLLNPLWAVAGVFVILVAGRRVTSSRNIDEAWSALVLTALLVSPLGWVHYIPIVTGPMVAVLLAGTPSARNVAVVGWLLLCVPFAWLKSGRFGPVATATVASSYVWGVLFLLVAALGDHERYSS